ncbi:ABC transporter ATP-binding protein [Embleya scabrispora]|uniref:ABC transporter ATP-binding protein n=1 Tax=Embleya scabrispora TaxID=159449 RepID=UPI000360D614|nr:oligopeptide/dipeptide ABC transporter ATP-binding protein [Embleya scabrispora]
MTADGTTPGALALDDKPAAETSTGTDPLLTVTDLVQRFRVPGGMMNAVAGVSFELGRGRTLGLVGESGCGKSTLARAILQLTKPSEGSVRFDGQELTTLPKAGLRTMRRRIQMVFQDPISALNPRRKIFDIVAEGLVISGMSAEEIRPRVEAVLRQVGLDPELVSDRRPHQFSGGQCQRIAIARAMVVDPDLLICDEPVASLDVSVQAQVLDLLDEMKTRTGVSMIFVAHDLAVVRNISDDVAVMYLGTIAETGDTAAIYDTPAHPYTRALLDAVPAPDPAAAPAGPSLKGEIPSPMNPPSGCRFRTRCPIAREECAAHVPTLREIAPGHRVACHFPLVGEAAVFEQTTPAVAVESKVEADAEPKPTAEADTEPAAETDAEPKATAEADAESKAAAEAETEPAAEAEPKVESEPVPAAEPKADAEPKPAATEQG